MKNFAKNVIDNSQAMSNLISAPLTATSYANVTMARKQMEYILEHCFTSNSDTSSLEPITVKLLVSRNISDKENKNNGTKKDITTVELPVLTLLPFSALCVKNFKANFALEIKSQHQYKKNFKEAKKNNKSTELQATVSSNDVSQKTDSTTSSKKAVMKIEISGGEIPLPNGLKIILDAYTNTITTI